MVHGERLYGERKYISAKLAVCGKDVLNGLERVVGFCLFACLLCLWKRLACLLACYLLACLLDCFAERRREVGSLRMEREEGRAMSGSVVVYTYPPRASYLLRP